MDNYPDKLAKAFMQTAGKNFVTLSCVQTPHNSGPKVTLVFSGFLVEMLGAWCYVTAGHIIEDIELAKSAGSSFDIWRLGDQTASEAFGDTAIPFDYDSAEWLTMRDDSNGMDYAITMIGGLYRKLLEAKGAVALDEKSWSDHTVDADQWALMGIPSESVKYDGVQIITSRVVVVPLHPAEEPPAAGGKAANQFYARPADGSEAFFRNADGFSGSPVFALKKINGERRYVVIGIQSAWYRSSKTMAICPFASFAREIRRVVAEAMEELKRLGMELPN